MCDCDCRVTLICQIQCGSVLSSVILQDDFIHPGVLLGNLSERTGVSDSDVKAALNRNMICIHLKRQAFFLFC